MSNELQRFLDNVRTLHELNVQKEDLKIDIIDSNSKTLDEDIASVLPSCLDDSNNYKQEYANNIVYLPRGLYTITKPITLKGRNIKFICEGTLKYTGNDCAVRIHCDQSDIFIEGVQVTNPNAIGIDITPYFYGDEPYAGTEFIDGVDSDYFTASNTTPINKISSVKHTKPAQNNITVNYVHSYEGYYQDEIPQGAASVFIKPEHQLYLSKVQFAYMEEGKEKWTEWESVFGNYSIQVPDDERSYTFYKYSYKYYPSIGIRLYIPNYPLGSNDSGAGITYNNIKGKNIRGNIIGVSVDCQSKPGYINCNRFNIDSIRSSHLGLNLNTEVYDSAEHYSDGTLTSGEGGTNYCYFDHLNIENLNGNSSIVVPKYNGAESAYEHIISNLDILEKDYTIEVEIARKSCFQSRLEYLRNLDMLSVVDSNNVTQLGILNKQMLETIARYLYLDPNGVDSIESSIKGKAENSKLFNIIGIEYAHIMRLCKYGTFINFKETHYNTLDYVKCILGESTNTTKSFAFRKNSKYNSINTANTDLDTIYLGGIGSDCKYNRITGGLRMFSDHIVGEVILNSKGFQYTAESIAPIKISSSNLYSSDKITINDNQYDCYRINTNLFSNRTPYLISFPDDTLKNAYIQLMEQYMNDETPLRLIYNSNTIPKGFVDKYSNVILDSSDIPETTKNITMQYLYDAFYKPHAFIPYSVRYDSSADRWVNEGIPTTMTARKPGNSLEYYCLYIPDEYSYLHVDGNVFTKVSSIDEATKFAYIIDYINELSGISTRSYFGIVDGNSADESTKITVNGKQVLPPLTIHIDSLSFIDYMHNAEVYSRSSLSETPSYVGTEHVFDDSLDYFIREPSDIASSEELLNYQFVIINGNGSTIEPTSSIEWDESCKYTGLVHVNKCQRVWFDSQKQLLYFTESYLQDKDTCAYRSVILIPEERTIEIVNEDGSHSSFTGVTFTHDYNFNKTTYWDIQYN